MSLQSAHSELVHAYLDHIRKDLDLMGRDVDQALKVARPASPWHPVTEVPADGRYIVRTNNGSTYFLGPIGGRWMENVEKWMEIPE